MKKSVIINIVIVVVMGILFGIFFGEQFVQESNNEFIKRDSQQNLGSLCSNEEECFSFCLNNSR